MESKNKEEKQVLEWIRGKREIPSSLKKRGEIISSFYHDSKRKSEIIRSVQTSAMTVNRWIGRWEESKENRGVWLEWYRSGEITGQGYKTLVLSIFKDAPRPGAPATFDEKTIEKIVALAAADPEKLGLPFSRWSEVLLEKELVKRKIVPAISTSQIGRFLKRPPGQAAPQPILGKCPDRGLGRF